jgi:hypothetical protein
VVDVVVGVLTLVVGGVLCFVGYAALRAVISLWGGFAGFVLGGGLVAAATDTGFLTSPLGWVVAIALAVVLGLVAYLYYAVSVVIGMGAIGFALGTTVASALGVTWSWVVILIGVLVGLGLAAVAVVGDLPMLILAVLSSFAGASTIVAGVLLLFGTVRTDELAADTTRALDLGGGWYAAYLALAVVGLIVQLRSAGNRRGTLRGTWSAPRARTTP